MHYEITFTGTDEQKLEQAWAETKTYLGDMTAKLVTLREEHETIGNQKKAEHMANVIGLFWGIQGYYPITALEQFMLGIREI
jgi:hypothetical protein